MNDGFADAPWVLKISVSELREATGVEQATLTEQDVAQIRPFLTKSAVFEDIPAAIGLWSPDVVLVSPGHEDMRPTVAISEGFGYWRTQSSPDYRLAPGLEPVVLKLLADKVASHAAGIVLVPPKIGPQNVFERVASGDMRFRWHAREVIGQPRADVTTADMTELRQFFSSTPATPTDVWRSGIFLYLDYHNGDKGLIAIDEAFSRWKCDKVGDTDWILSPGFAAELKAILKRRAQ